MMSIMRTYITGSQMTLYVYVFVDFAWLWTDVTVRWLQIVKATGFRDYFCLNSVLPVSFLQHVHISNSMKQYDSLNVFLHF